MCTTATKWTRTLVLHVLIVVVHLSCTAYFWPKYKHPDLAPHPYLLLFTVENVPGLLVLQNI